MLKLNKYFLFILIIFINLFSEYLCKKQIQIGAIFDANKDGEAEMAFKYAIDRINMYNHHLEFVPIIQTIQEVDSFKAKQIACNLTEQGVAAIFGPMDKKAAGIVESIGTNLEIPVLQLYWDPQPEKNPDDDSSTKMSLNFFPSTEILSKGFISLIRRMEWKGFTILYQHDEALYRLQELLKDHGPSDSPITLRQLPKGSNFRELLKEIQSTSETHIVLDCDEDLIPIVLNQAKEVNLMQEYHSYMILSLNAHTLDFGDLKYVLSNITAFRLIDPESSEVKTAVRDWEQGELRKMRQIAITEETVPTELAIVSDAVNFFTTAFTKLYENEKTYDKEMETAQLSCADSKTWQHGFQLIEYMKDISVYGLSGPVEFKNNDGIRSKFNLEIIELTNKGFIKIGYFDTEQASTEGAPEVVITRKFEDAYSAVVEGIQNKTFRVVSREGEPYLIKRVPKPGEVLTGNDQFEGYCVDLIDAISKRLGFKYEFHLVYDGEYGVLDSETGKWNGIIQELLVRKADLGICDLTINQDRRSAVDFTPPFMTLGISILFSKEEKKEIDPFAFLQPFSVEVWVYMATAFVGTSICLFIIARLSPHDWENPHPCDPEPEELENIWDIKNTIWLSLGSIMTQGCDILPKGNATRIAAGAWWFFTLIMVSSYTANLAACLTNEKMNTPIKSAEDLVKQSKIKYGSLGKGSTATFLRKSNYSTYKKMWTIMESTKPSVFVRTNAEGVERVKKSNHEYAFIMESSSIEYITERNCNLEQVGGLLDSKGYGIAMPFDSPYRTAISKIVLSLQEHGELQMLKKKWWKELNGGGACKSGETKEVTVANEMGIKHVFGVFLVLGVGCGIAFFVAILEFLWNVRKVTVENMISPWEALWCELKFAVNICNVTKPVAPNISEPSSLNGSNGSGDQDNRSIAASVLRSASSFLRLDNMFENKLNSKN